MILNLFADLFFESRMSFDEGTDHTLEHAAERIRHIRASAEPRTRLPARTITRGIIVAGFRLFVMKHAIMGATKADITESE